MCKKLTYLISFVLVLSLTNSLLADWTGAVSSDWYDAANWTGSVPTSGEQAQIQSLTPITWPIINGGNASTGQLRIAYTGNMLGELTVTGGATLNVSGELRLARNSQLGQIAKLYISGAATTINVTQRIECGRYGDATIDMTGGYLHCDDQLELSYREEGAGKVYLSGGTIDLDGNPGITAFAGDGVPGFALIDISGDGTLTLAGNQVSIVQTLVNDGIILAGGGEGTVLVAYDGLTTSVVATGLVKETASKPYPADEATDVPRDVVISWRPGEFAPLDLGTTYYWRVDEVNGAPDYTVHEGDVWSFTTEPIGYPIENIIATASSVQQANMGPENTVNGSGLDADDLHSTVEMNMWLSSTTGPQPSWIQYEFDKVYKLHEMWVWNSNQSLESVVGFGFKDVTIEYSTNGTDYTTLGTTHEFARAPGVADYAHNTTIDFGGLTAKYVRLTANSNWGGILPQYGLSEVRFFYIPVHAREPIPGSGATGVDVDVVLGFKAGREAAKHDVYLSTDEQAVIDGTATVTTVTETSYGPLSLDLAQTYYWRVDEVNEAETPATLEGAVWSFTTTEFLVVDDFESYNNLDPDDPESNRIFNAWIDGYEQPANGALVGYDAAPFAEQTIVHGGAQSMPLFYDNTGTARYSEAELTLSPAQDWTKNGVTALSLWFSGDPNNVPDQMYVKINGSKVTYDSDADNLARIPWQPWNIDLASLGIDLQNVTKFSIGFGDETSMTPGGSGLVFFDDIRLYPYNRQLATPADPGSANLVAQYEFEGTTNDSSGNGLHGAAMGDPAFVAGKVGQAISFDGFNNFVEITGYKGILGPNAVTVTAWINTTAIETGTIVGWGPNVDGQRFGFRIDDNRLRMEVSGGNVQADSNVNDGGWHHVTVTVQENATISYPDVILYVDGIDDTRATEDPEVLNLTADQDVRIGSRPSGNDRFFMGLIDDVRIYDRALTQEEIAWLAGRTKPFDKPF
ncbi:MAG: LamG-like jellyroll fold domain-containing protein [Planctomycetota bacterium]|jgi:hypothetical protein